MAEASISEDHFMCSVCLDLLKDPVTVPCGHTYCMRCITDCWNQEDQTRIYSCPQCRQTFSPRPVLGKNVMFAEMMEKLKKTKVKCAVSDQCSSGAGDVECDVCTGRKHKAIKSCLLCLNSYCQTHLEQHENLFRGQRHNLIDATAALHDMICPQHDKILEDFCRTDQQCVCNLCKLYEHKNHEIVSSAAAWTEKQSQFGQTKNKVQQQIQKKQKDLQKIKDVVESNKRCAQTAVEDCEMMFTELISSIERRRSEVTQLIRDQETAAVSPAEGLLERLKQEIDDLRRRDAELEKLLHTQHHIHLLQSLSSLSAPHGSTDSLSSITVSSLLSFDDVITSVSHLRDKLEHLCTRELEKISERGLVSSGQSLSDRPLQTTSLTQSRPSASFSGFDEKFKPPAGSWTCDTCLVRNMSSDKRCISCISPRLNIDSDSDSKPAAATSSLLSLFAPSAGSWSCDTCLIINKPEVVKCVCCNMAKPGTQVNSSLISPSLTKASSATSSTTTTSTGTGLLRFGDTFKKPEGSWDCDLCLVHNNTQDVKCLACETPKPGLVSSGQRLADRPLQTTSLTESRPSASISSSKPPAGSWTCDTCLIRNMSSDKRCVSCLSPRLNIDSDSDSKPAVATSSLLSLFAPLAGSWSCDTCSIINKPEVVKCVCCNMAKPGTQVNSSLISPSLTKASSAASSITTTSTGTGLLRFGDTLKKPEGSWDCDLCLVHNNTQDVKCVACETPKPGLVSSGQSLSDRPLQTTSLTQSRPSASFSGFDEKFKPPAGSWTCDTCLVRNMSSDKRCISCISPRLNIDSDSDSKPAAATSSLLSLFAPSAGSWSCDTCLIINKPEVVKCVCCNMAKPGTQVNSSLISPSLTKASSATSSTTTTSTGTGLLRFGDTFKKPEGSWDCDLCLVHNNTQDVKCLACETPKPGLVSSGQRLADRPLQTTSLTKSRPSASISSSKPPAGSWTCDTCLVRNMSSDKRCISCISPRLNIDSDSDSKPAAATSSLLSLFAPSAGSWSCDTCSIINKPEVVKCVCCNMAKPGTQVNSSLISPSLTKASSATSSTTTTSTGTGLLRFGDTLKKPEGSWDCNVCLVRNNAQDVKCIACETPKPGAEAVLFTSTPASIPGPLLGLSHKFKTPEGSWECEVCCVLNKAEDQNCVACQSKPKAKIQFRGDGSCSFMALKPERDDAPVSSKTILNTTTSSASNTIPVECQPGDPKFECRQDHLTGPPSPSFAFGKSVEAKVSSLSVFGQKPTPAPIFGSTAASSGQGIFEGGFGGTSEVWAGSAAPSAPAVSPVPDPFSFGQTPASNILSSEQNSSKDCIAARKIIKAVRRRK